MLSTRIVNILLGLGALTIFVTFTALRHTAYEQLICEKPAQRVRLMDGSGDIKCASNLVEPKTTDVDDGN